MVRLKCLYFEETLVRCTLQAEALRSSQISRSLPLPDLSRKIEGPLLAGQVRCVGRVKITFCLTGEIDVLQGAVVQKYSFG